MSVTSFFYEQLKFLKSPQNKWVIFEWSFFVKSDRYLWAIYCILVSVVCC